MGLTASNFSAAKRSASDFFQKRKYTHNHRERTMLFESYLVFLTIEITVLITAYLVYFRPEPQQKPKRIHDPWGIIRTNF